MSAVTAVLSAPFSRRMGRESLYLAVTLLPAVLVFPLALLGIVATGLAPFGIGVPALLAVLVGTRHIGGLFRGPAQRILGWHWELPHALGGRGLIGRAGALLVDAAAWKGLLYALVKLPLTALTVYLAAIGFFVGGAGLTSPLWWPIVGRDIGPLDIGDWSSTPRLAVQGAVVFLVTPWFVRVVVAVDRRLAMALLAVDPAQARIAALESGRGALEADATARLRRIERNLHDGTQARLVLLGMSLSQLEARTTDPESRRVITAAQGIVSDAMGELREVIRGVRPPALDESVQTALASLAASSPVPVTLTDELATRPPDTTATALYFAASELLSNVVRHSGATSAAMSVGESTASFVLCVQDNGHGGAEESLRGTGLLGLRRRAEALDGSVVVVSPAGGPTTVTMTLPRG